MILKNVENKLDMVLFANIADVTMILNSEIIRVHTQNSYRVSLAEYTFMLYVILFYRMISKR